MLNRDARGTILVGSGISIPGGYPSVGDLTSLVLAGTGAFKHTDNSYYVDERRQDVCPHVARAIGTLKRLKAAIDPSLRQYQYSGREANYEDLVYVARQLGDFALGEIENPVVGPFLSYQFADLEKAAAPVHGHHDSIGEVMRETENYIRDVVWRSLDRPPQSSDHLGVFLEAIRDESARSLAIGTLNHDTQLETYLVNSGVSIWDGFGRPVNEVRYWSIDDATLNDNRLAFFKLHGSIDWFEFRPDNGTFYDDRIGIPCDYDYWHTRSEDGRLQMPVSERPLMLVGTFNKYIDYSSELFATVHARWRARLNLSDRLIVCGYGFGDRGINAQIVEWVYGNRGRKLMIINPNIEGLKYRCRGAIRKRWDDWARDGVLEAIDAPVQEVSAPAVLRFLQT